MNTLLTVLLLAVMLVLMPFAAGISFRRDKDAGIMLRFITGSLVLGCAVQVMTLVMRFFSCSFAQVSIAVLVLIIAIAAIMVIFFRDVLFYYNPKHMRFTPFLAVFLVLLLLQAIVVCFAKPDVTYDTTAESVQTILANDTVFTHNPLTGDALLLPVGRMASLQVLPVFYAFLAYISGAPVTILLYRAVPVFVLLLSYSVYGLLSHALFEDDDKRALFLCAVSLLNIFGTFSERLLPYSLLRCGWQGDTILFAVILPFMFFVAISGERRSRFCDVIYLLLSGITAASVAGPTLGIGLALIPSVVWVIMTIWRWARG